MKTRTTLLTGLALGALGVFGVTVTLDNAAAQDAVDITQHGTQYIDLDGDGYNDNAPDADGDGIPNGQDTDYVRPGTGSGRDGQNGQGRGVHGNAFVDEDGDGLNDNAPDADGDGVPNGQDADYVRPGDGSGNGSGNGAGQGGRGTAVRSPEYARMHRTQVRTEADYGTGEAMRQRLQDGSGGAVRSHEGGRGGNGGGR